MQYAGVKWESGSQVMMVSGLGHQNLILQAQQGSTGITFLFL